MLFDCCSSGLFATGAKNSIMKNAKDIHFNKKLIKQFHNLVECPATIVKRISMLESMESSFSHSIFEYENEEKFVLGMKYLLAIWEIILNGLNSVKLQDKYVLYRFIVYICYRKEFFLECNGFDGEELCIASERVPLIKRYLYLLKLSLIEAIIIVKESSNSIALSFASKVLAIACSRLPEVGEVVYTALRDLQSSRPCPIADIRFDVFNEEETSSECNEHQASYHSFETASFSPSISSSMPKSFSMTVFPSEFQESLCDNCNNTQSESYDDSESYEESESYEDSDYSESSTTESSEEEECEERSSSLSNLELQKIIHYTTPPTILFDFEENEFDNDMAQSGLSSPFSNQDMLDGLGHHHSSVSPQVSLSYSYDELPPLQVIDYTMVVDRLCYQALHNQQLQEHHYTFIMDYPSLYWWCIVNDSSIDCETAHWWKERFSVRDGFFFTFINSWFELIEDYHCYREKEILFPCLPGYFVILRSFLPSLQSCLVHQYQCGHIRSHYIQSSYNYNMAALKASQSALIDSSLLNILIELLFSQCNAYFINDVLTCFLYLEQWLQFIRSHSIAHTLNVKTNTPMNNNPEISILLSLERYLQIEHKSATRRKLNNLDFEENVYLKYGIKDGFLKRHGLEALIVSGVATNDTEANEAWNRLLEEDCLKQVRYDVVLGQSVWQVRKRVIKPFLYSESSSIHLPMSFDYSFFFKGLRKLLQQEQIIILKQFLLFFYNNSDMFFGHYRTDFITQYLFADFYRLFCHWDMNVRFIFHLILLYRCLHTKRSLLPGLTSNDIIGKISIEKWKQINTLESTKNEKDTIERLIMTHEKWRTKRKIASQSGESMICESKSSLAVFDSCLENESDAIDLVISGQIDSYLLQIIQQINHPEEMIISINKRHSMILSLAEYIRLLKEYEKMDKTNAIIEAPILDMSILVVDQGISTSDLSVCFSNIISSKVPFRNQQTKHSESIIRNNLFHSTYN